MDTILRFAHNNSIYQERVLSIAGPDAVARRDDRNGTRYELSFSHERLADLFLALEYAKNWETTTIEAGGRTLVTKQLREVIACYHACQRAEDPREFCRRSCQHNLFP